MILAFILCGSTSPSFDYQHHPCCFKPNPVYRSTQVLLEDLSCLRSDGTVVGMELEALNLPAVATSIVGLVGLFFYAFNEAQIKRFLKRVKKYLHRGKHKKKSGMHRFKPREEWSKLRLDGSKRYVPTAA